MYTYSWTYGGTLNGSDKHQGGSTYINNNYNAYNTSDNTVLNIIEKPLLELLKWLVIKPVFKEER